MTMANLWKIGSETSERVGTIGEVLYFESTIGRAWRLGFNTAMEWVGFDGGSRWVVASENYLRCS